MPIILSMFCVSLRSAWIPANWTALKIPESVFSFTLLIAAIRSGLPTAMPIRQPVML